jgi:hypothetical protein
MRGSRLARLLALASLATVGFALLLALLVDLGSGEPAAKAAQVSAATATPTGTPVGRAAAGSSELCSFLASPAARNVTWSFRWEDYVSCGLAEPLPEPTATVGSAPPSAGPLAAFGTDVRVNDPSGDVHPNETQDDATVAVKGNTVCVAYNDDVGGVGFARSVNGGAAFADQGSVSSSGDPVLTVDADGHFALAHMRDGDANGIPDQIVVSISDDGCQTFPQTYIAQQSAFVDKPWVAADRTGGSYDGRIYTCWMESELPDFTPHIKFRRGIPFVDPIVDLRMGGANNLVEGCQIAVGKDGEVFVAWEEGAATDQAGSIWLRRSLDGGDTFQAAVKVGDLTHAADPAIIDCDFFGGALGPAAHPIRIQDFPSLAASPVNDDVYLVWNERRGGNTDIVFYRSVNDGGAWSFMRIVHDVVTRDQFMPAVAVAPDGTIKVQWYDRRDDPNNAQFHLYAAKSTNRGVTFQEERVTDAASGLDNFVPMPPAVCYMGDYNGLAADAKQFFHVWGDNRDTAHGHLDPNVYFDSQPPSGPVGGIAELPEAARDSGRPEIDGTLLAGFAALTFAAGALFAARRIRQG